MAIDLIIPVSNVDEIYGTAADQFDTLRLYSASSRGGTYSLLTSISLASGDTSYSYTDNTALSSTWYKVTFYNSVTLTETDIALAEPFPAARDITTRKELRQKVIRNFGAEIFSATSLAAQSATALSAADSGDDTDWFVGWHLYRPNAASSADYDRRVTAESGGTFTHGGAAYSDTTATSEELELCPLDISFTVLNEKIGDGLANTRYLYRYEFGATSGQKQYMLPNFVEGPEFVPDGWLRFGSTVNEYRWEKLEDYGRWWRIHGSNFQCVLSISPSRGDNEVIALDVWRPGEALASETDFTVVQPLWAEAAAMVSVLEFLITRDLARHNKTNYGPMLQVWEKKLRQCSRKYGPTPGMRMQIPSPISSFPEV